MVKYEVEMWSHFVINIFFPVAASFFLNYDPDYSTPNYMRFIIGDIGELIIKNAHDSMYVFLRD